jgi:hypothetical protein
MPTLDAPYTDTGWHYTRQRLQLQGIKEIGNSCRCQCLCKVKYCCSSLIQAAACLNEHS